MAETGPLRIAYCMPVLRSFDTEDSSAMLQMLIVDGLRCAGLEMTFLALRDLFEVVRISPGGEPTIIDRKWTKAAWFDVSSRLSWRLQQAVGLPYLNVFSNLRWYDACVQYLPGHDIVQERNGLYKMGVAMACRRLKLPYIVFHDADDILEHDLFGKPLTGILRWRAEQALRYNLRTAARVICVSSHARRHLVNTWHVPEEKIAVFPNGVDVDHFRPRPEEREAVRRELGVGNGPLIIFTGSFFPYQDIAVLLQAFAAVLGEVDEACLLLIGKGEQYEGMTQLAGKLVISRSTRFLGFRPHHEIARLLAAADVAVAPYRMIEDAKFQGSPMKLFEYMAVGLPVIASDLGQIGEVIRDRVNGVLVPAGDARALAGAMRTVIGDPGLRAQLGREARKDAIARYSWKQYISRLAGLYESVLSCTSKSRCHPCS